MLQLFSFSGRSSRFSYWSTFFAIALIFGYIKDTALAPLILILLIPYFAVQVRRCNDSGLSKWNILGQFIPVIGFIWLIRIGVKTPKAPTPAPAAKNSQRSQSFFDSERTYQETHTKEPRKQNNPTPPKKDIGSKKKKNSRIILCPSCSQRLKISIPLRNETFRCKTCHSKFTIKIDQDGSLYITHVVFKKHKKKKSKQSKENPSPKPNNEEGPTSIGDCFSILGLQQGASKGEIRKAYLLRIKEYHPDKVENLGEKLKTLAAVEAKKINASYQMLQDRGYA